MAIRSLLKNKTACAVAIFVVGLFFFGCSTADAATLQINSSSAAVSLGSTATLSVVLNSQDVAINNAEATINFPTDLFSVVSINKDNSIFSLWVEDPTFSNSTGVITFNGGVPTPGFNGAQGSVISIVVKAKKAGQAEFTFSGTAVRANDGLGTDVLTSQQGKTITVVQNEAPTITTPAVSPLNSSGPVLQVSSLTHPNQDQWYKDNNPVFQWTVPSGVDAVETTIDSNTSGVPHVVYGPAINEKMVKDRADGVWYFKVRARKNGVWGPISTYVVRIDTTAPVINNVTFSYDDSAKVLNIASDIQDVTSGIDHYDIYINDTLVKTVPAAEFVNGSYSFVSDTPGDNTVKLVATDRAGNSVGSSGNFHATTIAVPQLWPLPSVISADDQLTVRGITQNPNTDITVNIQLSGDAPIVLKTKSGPDSSFFVLAPKLQSGDYNIWAEAGFGDSRVSSLPIHVKVTTQLLVTIGPFAIPLWAFAGLIILVTILLVLGTFSLGRRYRKIQHKFKMRGALTKSGDFKVLIMLKKRFEKHLEMLQHIRRGRILIKEEKEIKEAIEGDLDEVDRAIANQKG